MNKILIIIKVGIMAEGIATSTNMELRKLCRKNNITKPTMNIARIRSCTTASADANVYNDWSDAMVYANSSFEYSLTS